MNAPATPGTAAPSPLPNAHEHRLTLAEVLEFLVEDGLVAKGDADALRLSLIHI